MILSASAWVNGSTSFRVRLGSSMGSTGFFWINPSAIAERSTVPRRQIALRLTPGEDHSVSVMIRRSRVVVIKSRRVLARCGCQ
ncbi:hypothetical protein D3C81_1324480 [compost metagenome]